MVSFVGSGPRGLRFSPNLIQPAIQKSFPAKHAQKRMDLGDAALLGKMSQVFRQIKLVMIRGYSDLLSYTYFFLLSFSGKGLE